MICELILITGFYPLMLAWRANRHTTLRHALGWGWAAWITWGLALTWSELWPGSPAVLVRYVALCLTGCAAVAVLGARWPGVGAWHLVVLAQLGVLLLPVAEGLGELHLDPLRLVFLGATLAVGVLNYLPTRLAAAVVSLAIGCGIEVWLLHSTAEQASRLERITPISRCVLAGSPWLALFAVRTGPTPLSQFDAIWIGFRDRFGLVWGLRVREQFNCAAGHAGWPVVLRWRGLRVKRGEKGDRPLAERETVPCFAAAEVVATLRALLKRFVRYESPDVRS
jgi:hypothetical protein